MLFFATLLHDVGKAIGGKDHSERGALMADGILKRLGWPNEDIAAGFRFRGGTRVVYRSDQDPTAALELFSVPTNGSQVSRKHSAPLVPNGNVLSFQLSADGTKVAYLADQDGDEVVELFLSDLGGLVRTVPFGAPPRPADRQF